MYCSLYLMGNSILLSSEKHKDQSYTFDKITSSHPFSAVLGSEEFVLETKEKFMRESGVTQASRMISIRITEDKT